MTIVSSEADEPRNIPEWMVAELQPGTPEEQRARYWSTLREGVSGPASQDATADLVDRTPAQWVATSDRWNDLAMEFAGHQGSDVDALRELARLSDELAFQASAIGVVAQPLLLLRDECSRKGSGVGEFRHEVVRGFWMSANRIVEEVRNRAIAECVSAVQHERESALSGASATRSSVSVAAQGEPARPEEVPAHELAGLTDTEREVLKALAKTTERGLGLTLDSLASAIGANHRSTAERAIRAMRARGFEIPNEQNGAGYFLRGTALQIGLQLLRMDAETTRNQR